MTADRRVDAARAVLAPADHACAVQRLAHAVQPLELESPRADARLRARAIQAIVCALCVANIGYSAIAALRASRAAQARYETSVCALRVNTG